MKTHFKRPSTWILPCCWLVIAIQALYILQTRKPEVLRTVGLEDASIRFFTTIGLMRSDPFWELSRGDDRSELKQALQSIDKYSTYLSEDQFKSFSIDSRQEYEGIGVSLQGNPRGARVREVFEGSPAAVSGISVGDVIFEINGQDLRGWSFTEVVDHIRGNAGTQLQLRVIRKETVVDITLRRDAIDIPSIHHVHLTEDGIIYLKIEQFGEKTAHEFLDTLRTFTNQSLTGLVIDLRENTGGIFGTSIEMLDAFYPRGETMLKTRDAEKNRMKIFRAKRPNLLGDIPTIILVNRNSASASEILAGSLQVTGKALIIGEKTLGKGSIQTVYRLQEGDAYKKTTSYYLFPDDSTIHEVGIQPDVQIQLSDPEYYAYLVREQQGIAPFQADNDPYWTTALRFLHDR